MHIHTSHVYQGPYPPFFGVIFPYQPLKPQQRTLFPGSSWNSCLYSLPIRRCQMCSVSYVKRESGNDASRRSSLQSRSPRREASRPTWAASPSRMRSASPSVLGFRVYCLGFRVYGLGFRVQGLSGVGFSELRAPAVSGIYAGSGGC